MAELHVIGQLVGASGFNGHSVFCKVRCGGGALMAAGGVGAPLHAARCPWPSARPSKDCPDQAVAA
jgi:hypothetical protein